MLISILSNGLVKRVSVYDQLEKSKNIWDLKYLRFAVDREYAEDLSLYYYIMADDRLNSVDREQMMPDLDDYWEVMKLIEIKENALFGT